MSSSPLKNKLNGFTLIEILLAIILVLIIMILLFDTFSGIRKSDIQIEQHRQKEKNIYFFSNYMSLLIKNMSSVQVFYNIKKTYFFLGEKNKMVFLSKRPLYYPLYVLHFVCVEFKNAQLNYKEKIFNSGEKLNSFDIFDEPSIVLLKDIKNFEIQYYVWDSLVNRHEWKREINSFSGDQLPLKVLVEFSYGNDELKFYFQRFLNEHIKNIPKI